MRRGHVPQRTCRGCGRKAPKSELLRFVVTEGALALDQCGGLAGRGIYCCNHTTCRERLAKSKKIRKTD
ncbi:YlxR family protein [Desulfobulbus elongatus]|uniref:YlxR family protein n=1 Tax=Desulfobulbus elongatus TaxID=53332 RepID=UPI000687ED8D